MKYPQLGRTGLKVNRRNPVSASVPSSPPWSWPGRRMPSGCRAGSSVPP